MRVDPVAARFLQLPPDARRRVQLDVCRSALAVWEAHVRRVPDLSYAERVCGTRQGVDVDLPLEAIDAVSAGVPRPDLVGRYLEPIAALQDLDFELPEPVAYAYYAIYNLFRKHVVKAADVDDWLIVSQAIGAHPEERRAEVLKAGLAAVG